MLDHDDLKWIATNVTELNRLLQQIARTSDQIRQHKGEGSLDVLDEQVEHASKTSQALFDCVTARIFSSVIHGPMPAGRAPMEKREAVAASATKVAVKIPVGEVALVIDEEPLAPPILNPKGTRELILVVDDDPELLELAGSMLEFEDYRVITAKDGIEALKIYRQMGKKIALIILDYFLPVMDGDAVFDELKAIDPGVQVVLS